MNEKRFDNKVRSGSFVLHVIADRVLTHDELVYAVAVYQKANKLKRLPTSGSATINFPVLDGIE